jgi:copper chaperone NosL
MKEILFSVFIFVLLVSFSAAGELKPVKPTEKDKCPVCGMFVEHFPDFFAQIIFKDSSNATFDGPKHMFKYYLSMNNYNSSKKPADIDSVYVTDFDSHSPIDAFKAFYVLGSDVDGPMGRELIPFSKEKNAKTFMKSHKGKAIVTFNKVTAAMLKEIDQMK